jgi:hypothetical protein
VSLRSFIHGQGAPRPRYDDAAETAKALLRQVDRAGEVDARALGLVALADAAADPVDADELALYGLTLAGLAERRFELAAVLAARRAERAGDGAHGGHGRTVDWLALTLGLLRRGHTIAQAFTRERVLFRKRLGDNPVLRGHHARHEAQMGALSGLLLHVIGRGRDPELDGELPMFRCFAATEAVSIADEQMQLMGGTGFMCESGMPAVRGAVLALIEAQRPEWLVSDAELQAWVGGELPAWLAGPSPTDRAPAEARQTDLLRAVGRFAAACADVSTKLEGPSWT